MEEKILARPVTKFGQWMAKYVPYRRQVILKNIDIVFADTISPMAKQHLLRAFYSHLGKIIQETFGFRSLSEEEAIAKVDVLGHEHLLEVAEKGEGILILTGHFGNWEFAPLAGIMKFKQFKGHFHFIRKSIGFKFLENILFKRYLNAGLRIINKTNALHKITEALSENHAVVFVLDQHASLANKDGLAVEFFGQKAGTYRSLAMLAQYTKVGVVPAASYRQEDGRHVLKFYPALALEEAADSLYANTRRYNQVLEQIILEHPEQWWWLHRRWKLSA